MPYLVKDFMEKEIVTVEAATSVTEASKIMKAKNTGYLIVFEKREPAGIVTDRDLVLKVIANDKDPSKVAVREIMSTPIITIDPDVTVEEAIRTMTEHEIRRLPVGKAGILYGMFTGRDLAKHLNEYEEKVANDIIKHMSLFSRLLARGGR